MNILDELSSDSQHLIHSYNHIHSSPPPSLCWKPLTPDSCECFRWWCTVAAGSWGEQSPRGPPHEHGPRHELQKRTSVGKSANHHPEKKHNNSHMHMPYSRKFSWIQIFAKVSFSLQKKFLRFLFSRFAGSLLTTPIPVRLNTLLSRFWLDFPWSQLPIPSKNDEQQPGCRAHWGMLAYLGLLRRSLLGIRSSQLQRWGQSTLLDRLTSSSYRYWADRRWKMSRGGGQDVVCWFKIAMQCHRLTAQLHKCTWEDLWEFKSSCVQIYFHNSYFRVLDVGRKICENLDLAKIFCYTVSPSLTWAQAFTYRYWY